MRAILSVVTHIFNLKPYQKPLARCLSSVKLDINVDDRTSAEFFQFSSLWNIFVEKERSKNKNSKLFFVFGLV